MCSEMDVVSFIKAIWPTIQSLLTYVAIPLGMALWKSERLALDKSTQASGIVDYFQLANTALKIMNDAKVNPTQNKEN